MTAHVFFDLEETRRKLEYFTQLKNSALAAAQASGTKPKLNSLNSYDKWLEIYSERATKLERQASKLGLRTQLSKLPASEQRA